MSFEHIFGHRKQIEFLTKSVSMGKVAHAYLFSGPAFVGKRTVASKFARALLDLDNENFHPDYLEISDSDGIKIEQIRDLIYKLSLKPYQARYKVALIDNAETMTVEAQNALLKILEEPKSYTVIILVTANSSRLLRTISSRTQKLNFGPVAAEEYRDLLSSVPEQVRNLVLDFADGRPGLARLIPSNEDWLGKLQETNENFDIIASDDLGDKLKLAGDLADFETADLKQTLEFWLIRLRQKLLSDPEILNARNLSFVNQSRRYLDLNVNSKLLLTNLMLELRPYQV